MIRDWLRRKRPARARRAAPHAEWLEPRLLYSADAGVLLAAADSGSAETRLLDTDYEYTAQAAATPASAEITAAYAQTPLQFEINAGQLEDGVDFAAFGIGYAIALDGGQAEILLAGADGAVRLELVGAARGDAVGEVLLETRSNYLVGQDAQGWVTDIANYGSVLYRDVYEGIDVRYYGNQGQLEYDFIVAAGADASKLQLRFSGVDCLEITPEGALLLRVAGTDREIRFAAPFSYQQGAGGREAVASHYELQADGTVRIVVGEYDTTRELVVDPVLLYATYFGDSGTEQPLGVAVGDDGSVYVTGHTNSTAGTLSGALGGSAGSVDMFVAKYSADLATLLYSTRIGGSGEDRGNAIAVDAAGQAIVAGTVTSSNFPTAGTAVDQAALSGTRDAVVLKLNAAGNGLVFSTYFGSTGNNDAGAAVALGGDGRIYVAGTISVGNNDDAFVNIYDADGMRLETRQFGGTGSDGGTGLAVDDAGNAYLVGRIGSSVTMVNGHQTARGGGPDGFLVRYNVSGTIDWSSYIGYTNGDSASSVAVDGSGRAYVIGRTDNPASSGFVTTSGALITTADDHNTGYFRIYDTTISGSASLEYSSFVGGSGSNDIPTAITLIGGTRAVIVGHTDSVDLPTTSDALRRTNSTTSGFALVIDTGLTGSAQLAYGTYFANGATMGGVAVTGNTIYFVGSTTESGLATIGAHDTTVNATDGFVAAIGGFSYNTAPTLTGTANLPAIAEDSAAGAGALVSSLFTSNDPDAGAEKGVAIVAADSANGTWQYTLDGSTWTSFTSPASGSAFLLAADDLTRVRFVPAADFNGTSSIVFHAWDRTTGTAGTVRALGVTGGGSAFSSGVESSSITVTPVNDLPVAAPASATGEEDAAAIAIALTGSDLEDGSIAGVQVLTAPADGLLYTDAALQNLVVAGTVYAGSSVTLYFAPAANFEGTATFTFAVIDSAAAASAAETATITVTAVNDAPVAAPASASGLEDAAAIAVTLTGSDMEDGAIGAVRLLTLSTDGVLYADASLQSLAVAGTVYAGGSVTFHFVPAADYHGTTSFTFAAVESAGLEGAAATAAITVAPVNDAPVQTAGTLVDITTAEGQTVSLGLSGLAYSTGPANEGDQTLLVTVTALPGSAGTIQLADGTPVVLGQTYTLAQLQDMRLQAGLRGTGTFSFQVSDSGGTADGGQDALPQQSLTLTVTNVAPVLASPTNAFTQLEDNPGNGTLVSEIIAGKVTDGGGPYGIAVVQMPSGNINGVWQYSLDGGGSWLTLSGSNTSSRLLGPDARVRFLSDAGENINGAIPGFTFRAWDGSSGAAGGLASTGTNGGTTAFSTGTATAQLTITPVNDIPVRFDADTLTFLPAPANVTVNEATGLTSLGFGYLEYIPGYSEEEYYNQTLTYTVTGVPGSGVGTVYLADGVTAVTANTSYTLTQLQGMRFRPTAGVQNASGTFSWKVQDNAGTDNGGVDTLLESIAITVRNVAPTLSGANTVPSIVEDVPGNGIRVSDLIAGKATDPNNILGIAVTAADAGSAGTWQYTSDGGTTWNSLSAASSTNSILLSAGGQWRVRFNPSPDWNGTPPGFTFRAWDRSTGNPGGTASTTVNGGTTAFSSTTVTATLWVGAMNDAPVRTDAPGVALSPVVLLDGSPMISLGLAGATFGPGGGPDEAGQTIVSYTITSLPSGLGTTYLADGTTAVVLGAQYTLAQIQGMQFLSSGVGALGTQAFSFAVKDDGGTANGGTDTATFSLNVVVNRAPVLNGINSPLTVFEDFDWTNNSPPGTPPPWSSPAQRAGMLVADMVAGQILDTTGSQGGIAIVGMAGSGTWQFSMDGGSTWTTITSVSNSGALQLAADTQTRLRFLPSADFNSSIGTASVTVRAWDQTVGTNGTYADATWNGGPFAYSAATATSVVTITPRNDAPIAVGATGGTVEEGAAPAAMLASGGYAPGPATASDETSQTLGFTFTALSDSVEILLADGVTVVTVGTTYTYAQFQGMLFRSAVNATPGPATVTFLVQDSGGTDNGGVDSATHSLALTVINRAPVLNGASPLTAILEDTPDNGTLVSDLVLGQVADPTGTRGIAVTAADNSNGSWQYTRDGGTTWTAFGSPAAGSARLLLADTLTRVRFVPSSDWNGTATLTFAAWDGTAGTAGSVADASVGGSGTAFSTATATTSITVLPVNDAPVGGMVADLTVAEDSGSTGLGLGAVNYGPGGGGDEAGQSLTFKIAGLPPATLGRITLDDGTEVVPGDYTIEELRGMRFVTAANAVGTGSFSFNVKDDGGGADTLVQTVTITVTPVNDAPVAVADVIAGTEDTPLTIDPATLTANDTDVDTAAGSLTVTGVTSGTGGTVALVDGNIVFTPAADFNGPATFGYTISDGSGGTATGTVRVELAAVNDAPAAGNDAMTATTGVTLVIGSATLLANDTDVDGGTLTITAVGSAVNGTVTLVGTDVEFEPTPLHVGPASFSYTVSDGNGGTSTAVVNINVLLGNNAPVAGTDFLMTPEDTPLVIAAADLLANDYDLDLGTLTITGASAAVGGTVSLSGSTLTFTPAPDFNGAARFTYTIDDGNGGSATGTVNVSVTAVNDAPVANADSVAGTEDQPLTIRASALTDNDTDPEGDTLTVTGVSSLTGGTVALVDGSIVFTPTPNFFGAASFGYTVADPYGATATGTVTVMVAGVNDAPVAGADTVTGTEDETLTIAPATLLGNDTDVDGDALSITEVANPVGGTVEFSGGGIVFTPTADFNGNGSFSYTVSDANGGTSTATVTVNVAAVNDDPVANDDAFLASEDTPLTISPAALLSNDADSENDALVLTGVAGAAGGTVTLSGGNIVFTPDADFSGTASFTYTVSDGNGGTAAGTVTVTVTAVNDAPVAGADVVAGTEDTPLVIAPATLLANDTDAENDALGIVGLASGTGGTVAFSGENIVFTPTADFSGAGSFSYTVSDGHGGTATRTVTVNIAAVNDAPLARADVVAATEDVPLAITAATLLANDGDVENDALTITGVSNATHGVVAVSGGAIVFTPNADFHGVATFTYTMSDGNGGTSAATVTVNVAPVNDAPLVTGETAATDEDTPLVLDPATLLANDTDPENDPLTVVGVADGAGGQVNVSGGNIVFTPDANFNGPGSFYYTVADGNGGTATVMVTVNVAAVNDAPLVTGEVLAGTEDAPLAITAASLLANDSDVEGSALTITGVTAVSGGSATLSGGTVTFTPTAHFNGPATFTYTVSDGNGGTSTGTVTVNLAPLDDAPVASDDAVAATEDVPLAISAATLLANDHEFDGEPLAITGVASGTGGTVALSGGSIVFTPAADFNGAGSFTYTISDGNGGTSTATVTVLVAAVNDAPVASGESVAGTEDQALATPVADLLANDTDADGNALAITGVSGASGGTVALSGGTIVFTPTPDFHGPASFSYTVSDGQGGTATANVAITLAAVDDPTLAVPDVASIAEDTVATGNVLGNDSDVETTLQVAGFSMDGTAYAAGATVNLGGIGSFTLAADGSYSFTPVADWHGTVPQVTYSTNTGASSTLDLTVTAVDDATAMNPEVVSVAEDTVATGNVLANDGDVETALQVAAFSVGGTSYAPGATVSLAGVGSFTLGASGAYSFTPLANWNGAVPQVTYTTNTGASSTLDITVTAVDDATVMAPEATSVAEDMVATGNVLANDSDVDTALQVAGFAVGGNSHAAGSTVSLAGIGSFTLAADGSYSFTPAADWNGNVPQVTYTTNTGASSTLDITLTPVDDATVTNPEVVSVDEDTTATGNVLANDSDVDSTLQVASFSIAGASYAAGATASLAGIGSFTLVAGGAYSFTPLANWSGAVPQVTYTTNTGASSTLDLAVNAVDDATVVMPDLATVSEDTPAMGNVLDNDSDVETGLQVAGYSIGGASYVAGTAVNLAGVGSFTLAADGSYIFTPAADWNGSVPQVTYTTNTGASSTLDIAVTPVDDATVIHPDAISVDEDTPVAGNVLANDSDVDSTLQVASFSIGGSSYAAGAAVDLAGVGGFTLAADGSYTFTPVAHWNGAVPQVSYTTSTGAVGTLDIALAPVDDATAMNPETVSVAEDTIATGNVLGNDSDVETTLQVAGFSIVGTSYAAGVTASLAGVGSFTLAGDGSYTFTPIANWNGTVPQVAYTTNTGASSTLDIAVTPVDDVTVVNPETVSVAEDTAATGNVLANDSDVETTLQVATFTISGTIHAAGAVVAVAGAGSFTLGADGAYSFTPAANWNGAVPQVTYTTNTGASSSLSITVDPVDDATLVNPDVVATSEDTAATGNVLANDSDAETSLQVVGFVIGGTSHAAGATVSLAGVGSFTLGASGAYTFTPAANWNGAVPQVTYTTNTGASSTLDLSVHAVDDATIVAPDLTTVSEDTPATGNVLDNDTDVETPLQVTGFSIAGTSYLAGATVSIAGAGTFTLGSNGSYAFTPAADWNGSVPQVTYTTNTGASSTLAITVAAVDDPTMINPDVVSANEDAPAIGNVLANDTDVDSNLQVASFSIGGTSYAAGATASLAGIGSFTLAASGAYGFTPAANWNGAVPQVSYTTSTGASSTLDITIAPVDDATVMNPETVSVAEDTVATGNVLGNDSDVETALQVAGFTIGGASYAAGATVGIAGVGSFTLGADGSYTFTPAANWNGTVPLIAYTTDTGAGSTLAITVTPVDDASVMKPEVLALAEDTAATGNVLANDSDVDGTLQVTGFTIVGTSYAAGSAASIAGAGSFTLASDGAYTFTPAAHWNGSVPRVTYTTNTGAGSTLDITVTAVDDATVMAPEVVTVNEDSVASGNVLANDSDVETILQVTGFAIGGTGYAAGSTVAMPGLGSFRLDADGSYAFTPAANWNGSVPQVSYTTNTGAASTLDIAVAAVDDATVMVAETVVIAEDTTATGNVLANDSDVETAVLQVTGFGAGGASYAAGSTASMAGVGSVTLAADGTYTFTPLANWNGSVPQLTYTTDTGATGTLAITVTPVDDPTVMKPETVTVQEDTPASGNVLANDGDPDAALQVTSFRVGGNSYAAGTVATIAGVGSFTLGASGGYSFTPVADWNGQVPQVAYTATTGAASTLDIAVSAVNDAPAPSGATAPAVTVGSGGTAALPGYSPGGGADESNQSVTVTITALPSSDVLQATLADGVTPVQLGASYSLQDFRGIRFAPVAGAGALAQLAWVVRDDGGTGSGGADSTTGSVIILVEGAASMPEAPASPVPPAQVLGGGAFVSPVSTESPAAPVSVLPATGRAAVNPLAMAGDALLESPIFSALLSTLNGFAPQQLQAVPDPGRVPALSAWEQRELRLAGLGHGDFVVTGFAGLDGSVGRLTVEQFQQALRSGAFVDELNRLRKQLREDFDLDRSTSITVAGLSVGLSVAYVLWLIRGGVLLGSYLSALPAWRLLDPLPVLARAGDEEEQEEEETFDPAGPKGPDPLRGFA